MAGRRASRSMGPPPRSTRAAELAKDRTTRTKRSPEIHKATLSHSATPYAGGEVADLPAKQEPIENRYRGVVAGTERKSCPGLGHRAVRKNRSAGLARCVGTSVLTRLIRNDRENIKTALGNSTWRTAFLGPQQVEVYLRLPPWWLVAAGIGFEETGPSQVC